MGNFIFACGITIYNPTKKMIEHILEYTKSFDKVFIFDNSDDINRIETEYLIKDENVYYINGNGNKGLPKAYNYIINSENMNDVDFFCTLDQDSHFDQSDIEAIKCYIENHEMSEIAIIAPYINYSGTSFECYEFVEERPWVITSGSFLNMNIVRINNLKYDEEYFIDKFEIDLCKQFVRLGYQIKMYYGSQLRQVLGEENGHIHTNHSPLRHRYLFRNRYYFNKKFFKFPKRSVLNFLQTVRHLLLIILYEDLKCEKILAFIYGTMDYIHGRMGKIGD